MRKVTQQIANAFAQGKSMKLDNTFTTDGGVYLHGNRIVHLHSNGSIYMPLAGWNTTTTRERLNGIAQVLGLDASFTQKDFEPYFNGEIVSSSDWVKVN